MKRRTKRILLFAVAMCMMAVCFAPPTAYAAGVSVSSKTCEVGDTVTVTVKFTQSNIGSVGANFTYDSSILEFVSGSGASSSGKIALVADQEGLSSLSASVKFKAKKAGTSTISVSTTAFYDMDENSVGNVSGSGKVTVKKETVSTPRPSTAATPTPSALPSIPVTIGEQTLYIARDLSGITLPDGFAISDITYLSDTVPAAVGMDGKLTLVYLTDADGQNGAFYMLDEASSGFYPFVSLAASGTYTVLQLPASVAVPDGYQQADLVIGDATISAWQHVSGQTPAFYLLYVMNPKGEAGLYLYDTDEGTLQRYADHSATPTPTPTPVPQQLTLWQTITGNQALFVLLGALLALCIALVVSLIVLSVKQRKRRRAKPLLRNQADNPFQEEPVNGNDWMDEDGNEQSAHGPTDHETVQDGDKDETVNQSDEKDKE